MTSLRARSASELVDTAIQLIRRHYSQLLIVSGIAMAPWLIINPIFQNWLQTSVGAMRVDQAGDQVSIEGFSFLPLFAVGIFSLVWYSIAGAVVVSAASQGYREGRVDAGAAIQHAISRFGSVLFASIARALLIGFGAILLLIGAVYFYCTYFGAVSAVMIEGVSGTTGLSRSRKLANGHRWHILWTMVLVFLIYLLISMACGFFIGLVLGNGNPTLNSVLSTFVSILIYPLVSTTEMLLFYDLKIRAEGYDMEVMASQLDAAGAAPAQ